MAAIERGEKGAVEMAGLSGCGSGGLPEVIQCKPGVIPPCGSWMIFVI